MDIVHKERVQSLETSYLKVMANVSFQEEEAASLIKHEEATTEMQEGKSGKPEEQTSSGWSKRGLKVKCLASVWA